MLLRDKLLFAITLAAGLFAGGAAYADQVTLQDGKVLNGEIIAEDEKTLTLKLSDSTSTIALSRRISKAQIKEISRPQHVGPGYVLIPITGEIGRDSTADSLRAGLNAAAASPKYIVLDIDSIGGSIKEEYAMLDVLAAAQRDREIVAYVHNAYSAAAILAMSCRKIYIAPRGVIGAAVPMKLTRNGPADIDAKFRSAIEAKQRAYVAGAGHDPLLLAGMMELDAEIYLALDADGHPHLAAEGPGKRIKAKGTILTLTADEAAECGLAQIAPDLSDLGRQLTGGAWHEATHQPWDAAMANAAANRRAMREKAEMRDHLDAKLDALYKARPELEANHRRIAELSAKAEANANAMTDLKRQIEAGLTQIETDYQKALAGGVSQAQALIAKNARDAQVAALRESVAATYSKLLEEGDALAAEAKKLRDRQKELLATIPID